MQVQSSILVFLFHVEILKLSTYHFNSPPRLHPLLVLLFDCKKCELKEDYISLEPPIKWIFLDNISHQKRLGYIINFGSFVQDGLCKISTGKIYFVLKLTNVVFKSHTEKKVFYIHFDYSCEIELVFLKVTCY